MTSVDFVYYICFIFETQTIKPFIVSEMTLKITQSHRQCHSSLDRLHFLSETGKIGYT